MNWNWKNIALFLSIALNAAVLAGYVYGAINPGSVAGSLKPVAPGLRDPNLTPQQIQAIKKIQAQRRAWFDDWQEKYRSQLLAIVDLLDTREPDWERVKVEQAKYLNLRRDYQVVQSHSWADINSVLTPKQGREYMQALREMIRASDFTRTVQTQ